MRRQPFPDSPSNDLIPQDAQASLDGARGKLSVREAGRKGGLRVRELINRGREAEARQREQRPH